ncbi:hypothetical protein [Glycomyces buryatensis]|uniref:Uncharacterized protein n=1 Tax=Glycomyces buryatensis TaxID=2570927 RepID=A0A4S8QJR9_9ACTN|nr:hypothetical protein [Glycomyces buryatensis]THV43532.1 hypothetical protein FAB82_00250 [Glycomyces buryatensis]
MMNSKSAEELPEEFRETIPEQVTEEPSREEPEILADAVPIQAEPIGNGWLLLGIILLVAVGVLMLLIFASGGNADSSMML